MDPKIVKFKNRTNKQIQMVIVHLKVKDKQYQEAPLFQIAQQVSILDHLTLLNPKIILIKNLTTQKPRRMNLKKGVTTTNH